MEQNESYGKSGTGDTSEVSEERGRSRQWNDRAVTCLLSWVNCKRSMMCLAVGILCLILFLSFDHMLWRLGKAIMGRRLYPMLRGKCNLPGKIREERFFDKKFFESYIPHAPQLLSGLQLQVNLYPFNWEMKEGKQVFHEAGKVVTTLGTWKGKTYIKRNQFLSTIDPSHAYFNFLLPYVMTGVEGWDTHNETMGNLSLAERLNKIHEFVKEDIHYQSIVNFIDMIDPIITNGLNLPSPEMPKITIRDSPLKVKFSHSQTYTLGKLQNLIFTYQGSKTSKYDKIQVDQYLARNIWREDVLCGLTDRRLLNMV